MAIIFSDHSQNTEKRCFIITPIGRKGSKSRNICDAVNEKAIKPALYERGFIDGHVYAAHEESKPGDIDSRVITDLLECELVIANVSMNNANVLYELAIRHFVGKPLITICDSETVPVFDIDHQRLIIYESLEDEDMTVLKKELQKAFSTLDTFSPDNHVFRIAKSLGLSPHHNSVEPTKGYTVNTVMVWGRNSNIGSEEMISVLTKYIKSYIDFHSAQLTYSIFSLNDGAVAIDMKLDIGTSTDQVINMLRRIAESFEWTLLE